MGGTTPPPTVYGRSNTSLPHRVSVLSGAVWFHTGCWGTHSSTAVAVTPKTVKEANIRTKERFRYPVGHEPHRSPDG